MKNIDITDLTNKGEKIMIRKMTEGMKMKIKKQRTSVRQVIAICLALVMFFGTAAESAVAFSERQSLDFALASDRYDLLVDHEELFDLSHWQLEDNELTELPPGIMEALLRDREEYFALSSRVREKAIFLELLNEGLSFSDLTEANRFFVFRQLDIACAAQEAVEQLFEQMERDGFSLAESIELVRIISSGIFDYEEAQIIFNTSPSTLERLIEVVYFEQFVQIFDVADKINARRLINMPFYSTNEFMGMYMLIEEIREDEEISEVETQKETVELPPAEETIDPPPLNVDSTEPKEKESPITCEDIPMNGGNLPNDKEQYYTLDEFDSSTFEQYLNTEEYVSIFEEHISYFEKCLSFFADCITHVEDDEISREEYVVSSLIMLADSDAFELARQMFLNNPLRIEIETTFIYGEVLRGELQVNLSEQERDHIQMQRRFVSYTSEEALANLLFADVFFTSENQSLRYLSELMFPRFATRLADSSIYLNGNEQDNLNDYIFDHNISQTIIPMSTTDHADIVSNPFALRFNANESVSLNTGAVTYRINALNIPGRNGFDLNLDLLYDSSRAYSRATTPSSCRFRAHFRTIHGLGEGWIFDLPFIQNNTLYVPGRGSFWLSENHIVGYSLHDMRLFNDNTFTSGSIRSNRRLTFQNGTSYFFGGSNVIGKTDRFGNTIRFEYAPVHWFWNNMMLLSRIVDTNGRIITLTYNRVFVDGQVRYFTVTITDADGDTFIINLTCTGQLVDGVALLSSIQNQVGSITAFTYSGNNFYTHEWNKNPTANPHPLFPWERMTDTIWLLTQVNYPSGAELSFVYDMHLTNYGFHGSRQRWQVASRVLRYSGQDYLRTTFGYKGDNAAFPQSVSRPPENHTHSVTVTQNNGLHTVYTFNNLHLNISRRTYNAENVFLAEQIMAHNTDRLPISIESIEQRGNFTRSNLQQLSYNRYGQVIQTVSPLARGSANERYRTDYTFDSRFGLPLARTSRPDAQTTIVERNTLSTDGRRIIRTYVYENDVRRQRTDFTHDTHGNITEILEFYDNNDTSFIQTQITYNSGTRPSMIRRVGVRDANGNLVGDIDRHFTYDTMWRTLSETDPSGYVTRWQYDGLGRITRITLPNGGVATYTYDDNRNTLTHRTVLGATYIYQYDGLGNLLSIAANGVKILSNIYDNRKRIIETRNVQGIASSQRTTFDYDIFDRIVERRGLSPTGVLLTREATTFSDVFQATGTRRITKMIASTGINLGNAPNIITFVQYDRFGRRTQEGVTGGGTTTYTHDLAGRVITEQSLGVNNTFTYNVYGVASIRNILGHTAQNTYDMLGRVVTSTDFMENTQRFTYDALGRIITHRIPFERVGTAAHYAETRYYYDNNGNITRQANLINAPGQTQAWAATENTFRHNRLVSSETGGANGIRTTYTYNLAGNVLTKTVGGATTSFTYNNRGQLTRATDALGQIETFTYDANGHLITHIDRNGTTFRMSYDNRGWMIRKEAWQNGISVGFRSYSFFATGAVRQANNGSHRITHYYDNNGRLRRQTETGDIVKTFAYNTANNMTQARVYINNAVQSDNVYTFDVAQRLETVTANGELVATYTYNANSNRTSTVSPNGLRTNYTHNLAGLITNQVNRHGNTILSSFDYLYYLDGNTRQVTENLEGVSRTIIYTYDLARRLIREEAISGEQPDIATITANTWAELRKAINAAPENVQTTIQITSNITAPGGTEGDAIRIPTNRNIVLVSSNDNAARLVVQTNTGQRHFIVMRDANLTLGNGITLSGGATNNTNDSGGVLVNAGSILTMLDGSIIENCRRTITGGAMQLQGSGTSAAETAIFNMLGGTIRDNAGTTAGSVNMITNSTFNMSGGTISGNMATSSTASVGGVRLNSQGATFNMSGGMIGRNHQLLSSPERGAGGVKVASGTFNMSGGSIIENSSSFEIGAGGVHVINGTFTMSGGAKIAGNSANGNSGVGGVQLSGNNNARFTMNGGIIGSTIEEEANMGFTAGGVRISFGTFTMNGGYISNNYGGGIRLQEGTGAVANVIMNGGTINGNTNEGQMGAGVHVTRGTFTQSGGTIRNNQQNGRNTANSGGGGVRVTGGTFTMNNAAARIESNVASGTATTAGGGGIRHQGGTVNITAGTITNNHANRQGGGIFSSVSGDLHIGPGAIISGNTPDDTIANMFMAAFSADAFDDYIYYDSAQYELPHEFSINEEDEREKYYELDEMLTHITQSSSLIDFEPFGAAGASSHSAVAKDDGTVWTWGSNSHGQLGNGTTVSRSTPMQVPNLTNVTDVAAAGSSTFALRDDGTVWAWGLNSNGQLGDGTTTTRHLPVQVQNLTNVVAIAASHNHTVALRSDGTVWTWGSNLNGQLGDSTTAQRTTPVQVQNLTNVVAISAGGNSTVALRDDGTVWAWGSNTFGQLGDGTTTQRNTPVQVQNLANVVDISAASGSTFALRNDGTVWAWGSNSNGQLGDGTTTNRHTPVQVQNLANVTAISSASNSTFALRADRTVWAWGSNVRGLLGDGTENDNRVPTRVQNLTNIVEISGGGGHALAVKEEGSVWAWGDNLNGQLGDGTTIHRSTPVQVVGQDGEGFLNFRGSQHPTLPTSLSFTHEFTFDNRGNRISRNMTGSETYTVTYIYDLNNRLLTKTKTPVGGSAEITTFAYDNNGNQLTSTTGRTTETKVYNAFNQLTSVSSLDMIATYTYRADGLRHSKTVNGVMATHVWLMGNIVLELDACGAIVSRFERSLTGRLINSTQHGYYLLNARGDVVQRINVRGQIVRNYRYTAFGVELNIAENNKNPFRFAGEYWDAETGTYYLRARNFNPRTGRFTQPDSYWNISNMQSSTAAILQSGNLYMYVMHNPVMFIDPSGQWAVPVIGGVSGGIVGGVAGGFSAHARGDNVWLGILGGAASGAVTGATGSWLFGGLASGVNAAFQDVANNRDVDWANVLVQATLGAGSGGVSKYVTRGVTGAFGTTPQGSLHGADAFAFGFSMFTVNVPMQATSEIFRHGLNTAINNQTQYAQFQARMQAQQAQIQAQLQAQQVQQAQFQANFQAQQAQFQAQLENIQLLQQFTANSPALIAPGASSQARDLFFLRNLPQIRAELFEIVIQLPGRGSSR